MRVRFNRHRYMQHLNILFTGEGMKQEVAVRSRVIVYEKI